MSRIAIVDLCFKWPPDGGAQTDVRELALRLGKHHEVQVFVPRLEGWLKLGSKWVRSPLDRTRFFWKGRIDESPGIDITHVPFGPFSFSASKVGERFRSAVEEWNPDKVWITNGWYLKPYVILALEKFKPVVRIYAHEMLCLKGDGFFFRRGKACSRDHLRDGFLLGYGRCLSCVTGFYLTYPSPAWIHEYITSKAFLPSYRNTVKRALAAASRIMVYNEFTADRVRPYAKDVRIVPGGVDPSLFRPATSLKAENRKTVILSVGRMEEPRKGISILMQAAELLREKRNDFEVWVTGEQKTKGDWMKAVGWKKPDQMPDLYRSADIVVVPSLWPEPYGMVALEAMACGKPVIVSRHGGLADIVTDGETGYRFTPGSHQELAQKLEVLIENRILRAEMGRKARECAVMRNDWDQILSKDILPSLQ